MLVHHGNFYIYSRNEAAMGSLIKTYEKDPLLKEAVSDFKLKFGSTFGKIYRSEDFKEKVVTTDISKFECGTDDKTNKCKSVIGYQQARKWFAENIKDLNFIKEDMIKFKRAKVVEAVSKVIIRLQKAENL